MPNTLLSYPINIEILTQALVAVLPGRVDSIRNYGPNRAFDLLFAGSVPVLSPSDDTIAQTAIDAHDPVYISIDKSIIQADGQDICLISIIAPKPGAATVTIVVTKPDNTTLTQAVTMIGGVGSVQFKTQIVGTYQIGIQNPNNRTSTTLTIQAGN